MCDKQASDKSNAKLQRYMGAARARARAWLRRFLCQHTHTFRYRLEGALRIYGKPHGSRQCRTEGLVLEGCYLCGRVKVRDSCA